MWSIFNEKLYKFFRRNQEVIRGNTGKSLKNISHLPYLFPNIQDDLSNKEVPSILTYSRRSPTGERGILQSE
ncbi:hypothetical protein, partial [Dapis sp. BLCC M229]|uniref:hypothetical protein n=1 Tax=Dapis sp. BLCC M229 TaxID=3400188 RepID=UPI003CF6A9F9